MPISIFEMFRVGVGPSSSHTVGPMRAAAFFAADLERKGFLNCVSRVTVRLMGSLGATGKGHATDSATLLGLMGLHPDTVDTLKSPSLIEEIVSTGTLNLCSKRKISFDYEKDMIFDADSVAKFHTNAMEICVFDDEGELLYNRRYYSVGGGFVVSARRSDPETIKVPKTYEEKDNPDLPYPYRTGDELVAMAKRDGISIADVVMANESARRSREDVISSLDHVWSVMNECIERGLVAEGTMPGRYRVPRRAKLLSGRLIGKTLNQEPLLAMDWVNAWAFAVGEENACGGRVVTSPTNGAAAVIPAVIKYYMLFCDNASVEGIRTFLMTAGAVGMLYKENASISGAEVGCQGEVGVACSMAAAGLAAVMGGTVDQVENAAEIGMEHNLGLTCDPIAGQVQIPCIERNAVAAVKAINAARLALIGDGEHIVSLDSVMHTMYETGKDLHDKYKETSRGGLAINVVEC